MPVASDRGSQIKHRLLNPTAQHVSDVRGAMGCYFCWLGEFDKCEKNCKLVHRAAGGHVAEVAEVWSGTVWDRATPSVTRDAEISKNIFEHTTEEVRRSRSARSKSTTPTAGWKTDEYARRPISEYSASHRRHPELVSLHRPIESVTLYKHPRQAEIIQATPYTHISITPASHCFVSRQGKIVDRESTIWGGTLAKSGTKLGSRPGTAGPRKTKLTVTQDEQLSKIISGSYSDAFQLPLPTVFRELDGL